MYKLLLFLFIVFIGCSHPHNKNPHILIETSYGDIEVELFPDKAPKTVAAFLSYVDSGYYTNSSFYRVLNTEDMGGNNHGLIQGGIWHTNPQLKLPGIVHESTKQTGLSHTSGTLSLARTTPGSANTEFFICVGDKPEFDYGSGGNGDGQGFAAFGTVFKGMDIVRKIQALPATSESFTEKISIDKIKRL